MAGGALLALLLTVGGWWLLHRDAGSAAWFGGASGRSTPEAGPDGKERGFRPFKVNGRDRHGLDRNGNGTACGAGD